MTPLESVRLGCDECDRDDCDGITPERLAEVQAEGWEDVREVQSYEDSLKTYDEPGDPEPPPGFCLLDWYTHLGTCPQCAARRNETS